MKLPNGETAIVDKAKIEDYCLSPTHLLGRHKARVFLSVLGITAENAFELQVALSTAACEGNAILGTSDEYGTRYIIDFELRWIERVALIRSSWMLRTHETSPRFLTCYVL
jgi:hypothetical protein